MSRPLLVVSLLLFLASDLRAQPLFYTVETLDWMAADSQVVVRAVVVDFADEMDGDKQKWNTVVIRVRETLKGKHKPFHTYVVPDWGRDKLAGWKKTEQELLVFLADTKAPDASNRWWHKKAALYDLTLRSGTYGLIELVTGSTRIAAVSPSMSLLVPVQRSHLEKVFTLDLQDPTDSKKIVEYTRTAIAAAEKVKPLRKHQVCWPRGPVTYTRVVPVTELLERQARKWIRSDEQSLREEGARALQFFKSDDNVAALKKLLQDPSFVTRVKQEGERIIETHRDYRVREAAFATLKSFGIEVPEPILREPLPRKKGPVEWRAHDVLPPKTLPRKVKGKQFDRIHSGLTLRELVALLGRGWMGGHGDYQEGCGIIRWTCEDGRELSVWPVTSRPEEVIEAGPRQLGGGGGRGRMWMTRPREGREPEDIPIPPK
jgi:hypothetical protein